MSTMNELASAVKGIRECKARLAGCLAAIKEEKEACRCFEKSGNKSDVRFVMENSRIEKSLGVLLSGRAAVRALFFDKGVLIVRENGMQWCSTVSEAVNALSRECEEVG